MKHIALLACFTGCIEAIPSGEAGLARRVDIMRGPTVAVVPPITDLNGDVFVVTGTVDLAGAVEPGKVHIGRANGGWIHSGNLGLSVDLVARGWIGVIEDRAWLWTREQIFEFPANDFNPELQLRSYSWLDTDPQSGADLKFEAIAPFIDRSISAARALAIVTTATEPRAFLSTLDLGHGQERFARILGSMPIEGGMQALGCGNAGDSAAFLLGNDTSAVLLFANADGLVGQAAVTGVPAAVRGTIGVGKDGSVAAVLADGHVLVGNRSAVRVQAPPIQVRGSVTDDDGNLWLTAIGPRLVPVVGGQLGIPLDWTSAAAADAVIQAGIDVVDERVSSRVSLRWNAHNVLGDATLVAEQPSLPYAVGVRGWLVGDAPIDRGGILYNDVAFVPLGVTFP